jgi:hypothetical protein
VITAGDAQQAGLLVWPHRDPLLRASLTLVSSDEFTYDDRTAEAAMHGHRADVTVAARAYA